MKVSRIALAALFCTACTRFDEPAPAADGGPGPGSTGFETLRFAPVADARVEQASPAENFGGAPSLSSDLDPRSEGYLRFEVSGVSGRAITGAILRLYVTNGTGARPAVLATSPDWDESTITWDSRPAARGAALTSPGAVARGDWSEHDLGALVTGDGTYSVVLRPESTDGFAAASREAASRPELAVTVEAASGGGAGEPSAAVVADALVDQGDPARNYGAATSLAADRHPRRDSYLRFQVSGVGEREVSGALLRLHVNQRTGDGPALFATSSSWDESTLTWNSRPATSGPALADAGAAAQGDWLEYDLRPLVTGDGTYSVALIAGSSDGVATDAREGSHPPEVVVAAAGAPPPPPPDGPSFTFAAAGDHGASPSTSKVLDLIRSSGADFFLSLGDLSYGTLSPETAWCDYVKAHVGAAYPFEIVSGSHEDSAKDGDGLIDDFVAADCLPNRLSGVHGVYGKEFYVDYPAASPTTRFIMISPSLHFDHGGYYDYRRGTGHYRWTAAAIDDARARGIRWIVVAMHRDCITMGVKSCEIGADIFNLLVARKVDLILQGHDHNYQRSRQLALSAGCPAFRPGAYDADCVADSGADGLYQAGAGPVLVINGMGGVSTYALSPGDPEAPYFASWMTSPTYGLVEVTVSPDRMDVAFVRAAGGGYSDSFSIVQP